MKTTVKIQNLKCGGCVATIINKLSGLSNITNVKVEVDENAVSFDYLNDADIQMVRETLMSIGYPEDGDANSLITKAKSYVSCAVGKIN